VEGAAALCRENEELSDEAFAAVAEAFGQHAGELALGSLPDHRSISPTNVRAGFRRTNPKIRVTARSGNTDEMLEALLAREIQMALIEGPEQRKDLHIRTVHGGSHGTCCPRNSWMGQSRYFR